MAVLASSATAGATCFTNATKPWLPVHHRGEEMGLSPLQPSTSTAKDVSARASAARMNCSGGQFLRHVSWTTFAMAGNCTQFHCLGFTIGVRCPGARRCTCNSLNAPANKEIAWLRMALEVEAAEAALKGG